jgi:hypothetical protein
MGGLLVWNAIGPLVGVVIGALLTPWIAWRWQHRQWIFDNKKQEYRDLLDDLFQASEEIIKARPNISAGINQDLLNAVWKGNRIVRDRIFVASAIRAGGIPTDWETIVRLAIWEPTEEKLHIGGGQRAYTINGIVTLRNALDEKLLAIAQRDLKL